VTTTREAPAVPARPGGGTAGRGAADMVAVPQQAAEGTGLRCRVLVDAGVHDDWVTWTGHDSACKGIVLDEGTRLAEVLYPAACTLQRDSADATGAGRPRALRFTVERVPRIGPGREAHKVTLTVTAARSPRGTVTVTIAPADPDPVGGGAR
jgi:hypothetical protein